MSWKEIIQEETVKPYFQQLSQFLLEDSKKYTIYPAHIDVFNSFKYCPLDKVKVVILGQDPYINRDQAHGLAFSVPIGVDVPPSLRNIFKEINADLQLNYSFPHGCLIEWVQQGVLLLNTVLTVRAGQSSSHRNQGWETFSDAILTHINQLDRPIAFLLWGSHAKSKKVLLNNLQHLVLDAAHPSPMSAYNGFFGCRHFSQTNNFLISNHVEPINWRLSLTG